MGSCAPLTETSFATSPTAAFDTAKAQDVFTFGYDIIQDRYLNKVKASEVALEGMKGIAAIDPSLSVERQGNDVLLRSGPRLISTYKAPREADSQGWARMTVAMAVDSQMASEGLRNANAEKLYQAAFEASLAKLDPFSRYAGADKASKNRAARNGFGGVGLRFEQEGNVVVVTEVMEGGPAEHAGLKVGDRISQIDGKPVTGLDKEEVSRRLRGAIATLVDLAIQREGGQQVVALQRALVVPPTVTTTQEGDGIVRFKVSSFNQRTASSLESQLKEIRAEMGPALKGVILDLRGNPGGLLDQAVAMSDLFMTQGTVVSTRGRHGNATQHYEAHEGQIGEDLPLAVLVDGKSASASEIVSAALQDSGRAVLIGTNSYGKGTVQTVVRMPNDGEMTLTWSRFHSPSGYALHGLGVLPNICTADDKADSARLIDAVASDAYHVNAELAQWRATTVDQTEERGRLRSTCPSAKHDASATDIDIAKRVLTDQALYASSLRLSGPVASASSGAFAQP